MKRTMSQCAHWWQRWFCQWIDFESGRCTKESKNHTSNITRDRNSSLFGGIPYRSSEFEVEMLEEASCARTHRRNVRCTELAHENCYRPTSFPSIRCGLHYFYCWAFL